MFSRRVALVVLVLVLLSKIAGLVLVLLATACGAPAPAPAASPAPATATAVAEPPPEILGVSRLVFEPAEYRLVNSGLATAALDAQVIMPGGTLSMNNLVGEPSLARGYMDGGCIIGGQWATCPGGGVSRVAAALCEAGHLAGMDVSGVPHSMITDGMGGYTPGVECTYAWPAHDTTLTNPTPYPVLIGARVEGSAVVVEIVGPKWFDVQSLVEPLTADCRAVVTRTRWLPDGTLFDEETRGTKYDSCR